ncbi:hypothetical protein QFZ22_000636 [Streptomyces canus]|uniref:DUF2637 domain-containing protein n=1 Tax=Streptomyces canus TaxID=58343 RepID=A0AAW8F3M8_9ACTN|nr:hypothetical protein [Streptomyces canus]MDQ0904651.1 hypothetical protein [Streptomyces canus]
MNAKNSQGSWRQWRPSQRGLVITVLGIVTLGVAILSMYVSYQILQPKFGSWAVPTVGALDALWVVMQATEILSGNNRARARRVQYAGLALTAINAAIPTTDLILNAHGHFDLAVILTPVAIIATKGAWWIALPSLGRKVSADTRTRIDVKRQQVADRLEEMEAEAADRIELLELATTLEERVAAAETKYRKSQLKIQQEMTQKLHAQAVSTAETVSGQALPAAVAAIRLPELGTWTPTAPALPVTADRDASSANHPALTGGRDASGTHASDRHAGQGDSEGDRHGGRDEERDAVTLAQLATVAGVPTPQPGEPLTDAQLDVVLRHLRYREDPPPSYRKAGEAYRKAGFVGSEERVRRAWGALLAKEEGDLSESEEEEDADA